MPWVNTGNSKVQSAARRAKMKMDRRKFLESSSMLLSAGALGAAAGPMADMAGARASEIVPHKYRLIATGEAFHARAGRKFSPHGGDGVERSGRGDVARIPGQQATPRAIARSGARAAEHHGPDGRRYARAVADRAGGADDGCGRWHGNGSFRERYASGSDQAASDALCRTGEFRAAGPEPRGQGNRTRDEQAEVEWADRQFAYERR